MHLLKRFNGAVAWNKDYCIPISPWGEGYFGGDYDQAVLVNGKKGDQCQFAVYWIRVSSGHCGKCAKSLFFFYARVNRYMA